jgi:hypothetical protein
MRHVRFLLAVVVLAPGVSGKAQVGTQANRGGPRHVLIIRHAEKTGDKSDVHVSKKGVERTVQLFRLFEAAPDRPTPFPVPDFIFAAANSANSHRPVETVIPLAKKLRLTIDQSYESKRSSNPDAKRTERINGMLALRSMLFGDAKYAGKTILISWRHSSIPDLARTLGAKDVPSTWPDECYDRVWQITFREGELADFRNHPQRLLPGDSPK